MRYDDGIYVYDLAPLGVEQDPGVWTAGKLYCDCGFGWTAARPGPPDLGGWECPLCGEFTGEPPEIDRRQLHQTFGPK